jgi:hypothetical protein
MAKVHRMIVTIVDLEDRSDLDVEQTIANIRAYYPRVRHHQVVKFPDEDWHDDHPLNKPISIGEFDEWMKAHNPTTLL